MPLPARTAQRYLGRANPSVHDGTSATGYTFGSPAFTPHDGAFTIAAFFRYTNASTSRCICDFGGPQLGIFAGVGATRRRPYILNSGGVTLQANDVANAYPENVEATFFVTRSVSVGNLNMYWNGVNVGTGTSGVSNMNGTSNYAGRNPGNTRWFLGDIYDMSFWNTELTATNALEYHYEMVHPPWRSGSLGRHLGPFMFGRRQVPQLNLFRSSFYVPQRNGR